MASSLKKEDHSELLIFLDLLLFKYPYLKIVSAPWWHILGWHVLHPVLIKCNSLCLAVVSVEAGWRGGGHQGVKPVSRPCVGHGATPFITSRWGTVSPPLASPWAVGDPLWILSPAGLTGLSAVAQLCTQCQLRSGRGDHDPTSLSPTSVAWVCLQWIQSGGTYCFPGPEREVLGEAQAAT